jgi:hypothetical protein
MTGTLSQHMYKCGALLRYSMANIREKKDIKKALEKFEGKIMKYFKCVQVFGDMDDPGHFSTL